VVLFGPDAKASTFDAAALRSRTELPDKMQFMEVAAIHKTADILYDHCSGLATNQ